MVAVAQPGCVREMGEIVPSRAFFHFLVPSKHAQQSLRSMEFRLMHQKTCFGGGCVPVGLEFAQGGKFP